MKSARNIPHGYRSASRVIGPRLPPRQQYQQPYPDDYDPLADDDHYSVDPRGYAAYEQEDDIQDGDDEGSAYGYAPQQSQQSKSGVPSKTKKRKGVEKDDSHPRKQSAWNIYAATHREEVKARHPELNHTDIQKLLAHNYHLEKKMTDKKVSKVKNLTGAAQMIAEVDSQLKGITYLISQAVKGKKEKKDKKKKQKANPKAEDAKEETTTAASATLPLDEDDQSSDDSELDEDFDPQPDAPLEDAPAPSAPATTPTVAPAT